MTTLCTCWKVTRRDATVLGFTDHDRDLTVGGVTYKSAVGFVPSSVDRSTELTADNQQLVGIIDSDELTAADLRNGVYTGARVDIYEVDWSAETVSRTLMVGHLGTVEISGNQYFANLISLEHELTKPATRIVSLLCDADLGDTRCGYTLTADSGTVTTVVAEKRKWTDTSLTADNAHYDGGKVVWLTGNNAGLTMDVKRYLSADDSVELYEPMPLAIQVGDTYNIFRGCDKRIATCADTFSNAANFRGFPHIPGVSDLVGGGT